MNHDICPECGARADRPAPSLWRFALTVISLAFTLMVGPTMCATVAHADGVQTIEGCHWSDRAEEWLYGDARTPCRGTGEDPTVDAHGRPVCADRHVVRYVRRHGEAIGWCVR